MSFQLFVTLRAEPCALQRVLGTVERRGYIVDGMTLAPGSGLLALTLSGRGHRPETPDCLARQLNRLLCVRSVRLDDATAATAATADDPDPFAILALA